MQKIEQYHRKLTEIKDWDAFLQRESNLPGPRANLELVQAVADLGERMLFERYIVISPIQAPENTPMEMLPICGTVGLGRLLAEGDHTVLSLLRNLSKDPRWRIREGVVLALERWGKADFDALSAEMKNWIRGNLYEKRAAVAALAHPQFLREQSLSKEILDLFDAVTQSLLDFPNKKDDGFRILRQTLGYGWSVIIVAYPQTGIPYFERWAQSKDGDIQWLLRSNLSKQRLIRVDPAWVEKMRIHLRKIPE